MTNRAILALLGLLAVPSTALAEQPPADLVDAMDINPADLVPNSIETVFDNGEASSSTMFDVRTSLGVISPYNAPDMALLSTGNVNNIEQMLDFDYPPGGDGGDRATLGFSLEVPDNANSYSFNFYFLSREYPEWVGNIYNDQFEVFVENPSFSGQIVFDAFGNVVSVNNALFGVTDPALLQGTGFDEDGGTGWVTTIAPVTGGSTLDVMFTIYDEADGVWDSAVLIDNFQFSTQDPPGDGPWTGDDTPDDPMEIAFLSPKEGDLAGGYPVVIHGDGFSETTSVLIDGSSVSGDNIVLGTGGESITIQEWPESTSEQSVDIELVRGDETLTLADGFTYWDMSGGSVPPRITNVAPSEAHPGGGTDVRVRGEGISLEATVIFIDEDGEEVAPEEDVVGVDLGGGAVELVVLTPSHNGGWTDLVVVNPNDLRSDPGYPFLFTQDAAAPATNNNGRNGGCDVAGNGGAAGLLGLLFIGLASRLRRREEV